MDLAALRHRWRRQATTAAERIPLLGRVLAEVVRIELIDRCMLIAAQGLLALVPVLVVLAAFFPHLTHAALGQLAAVTGLGPSGSEVVHTEIDSETVRTQTGIVGAVITFFSATSFARAVARMYERVWELPHVGGLVATRRCFVWLMGWVLVLQLLAAARSVVREGSTVRHGLGLVLAVVVMVLIWWVTPRVLLFGRVGWTQLAAGAALTGVVTVAYSSASTLVMPRYVESNARQFGTLGIVLSLTTWLIGWAAVLVGSALVGRVVSEDRAVRALVRRARSLPVVRAARRPAARARRPRGGRG